MFGLFKKKARKAVVEVKKMENRSGSPASSGSVPVIGKLRWAAAGVLLFLVVAIDFTSKMMSILADGVLVAGVIALLWPLIKSSD